MLKTPVAMLVFNRPELTRQVFEAVAQAKPKKLLVVADGPRANKTDDVTKCAQVRAIFERVDWDCEVLTNYSDANLGCQRRVVSGIDWVFSEVEDAIILEDDCLPDPSFFLFCEELLERFRHDERVMMIGGFNHFGELSILPQSYYYSNFGGNWGWASWRRAWKHFDVDLALWPDVRTQGLIEEMFPVPEDSSYWNSIFQDVYDKKRTSCWDYQWLLSCWIHSGTRIIPAVNLITNIGFGDDSTHTKVDLFPGLRSGSLLFPLRHPIFFSRTARIDNVIQSKYFRLPRPKTTVRRLANRFMSLMTRSAKASL